MTLQVAGTGPLSMGTLGTEGHCPPHGMATAAETGSYPRTVALGRPSDSAYSGLWLKLTTHLTFFSQVPISRPFGLFFVFSPCP